MHISRKSFVLFLLPVLIACQQEWNELVINSPDFKLQLIFNMEDDGKPTYTLSMNGKPV